MVGREIKQGEQIPPDRNHIVGMEIKKGEVVVRKYKRLMTGDKVEKGQLLVQLDDTLPQTELASKQAKILACQAE